MTVKELERELETVEKVAASNTDDKHLAAVTMRGVWEIALQLAKMNRLHVHGHKKGEPEL